MFDKIIQEMIEALKQNFPALLPEIGKQTTLPSLSITPYPHFIFEGRYFIGKPPPPEWSTIGNDPHYSQHAVQIIWNMLHTFQSLVAGNNISKALNSKIAAAKLGASLLSLVISVPQKLDYLDADRVGDAKNKNTRKSLPQVVDDTSLVLTQILLQGLKQLLASFSENNYEGTFEVQTLIAVVNKYVPGGGNITTFNILKDIEAAINTLENRIKKYQEHCEIRDICKQSQGYVGQLQELKAWRDGKTVELNKIIKTLSAAEKYHAQGTQASIPAWYERLTSRGIQKHLIQCKQWLGRYNEIERSIQDIDFGILHNKREALQKDSQYPPVVAYYQYENGEAYAIAHPIKQTVEDVFDSLLGMTSPEVVRSKLAATHVALLAKQQELLFVLSIQQAILDTQKKIKDFSLPPFQREYKEIEAKESKSRSEILLLDEWPEEKLNETIRLIEKHISLCKSSVSELASKLETDDFKQCSKAAQNYLTKYNQQYAHDNLQHIKQLEQISRNYQYALTLKKQARDLEGLRQLSQLEDKTIAQAIFQQTEYSKQQITCAASLSENEQQRITLNRQYQPRINELKNNIQLDEKRQKQITDQSTTLKKLADVLINPTHAKSSKLPKEFDAHALKDAAPDLHQTLQPHLTQVQSEKKLIRAGERIVDFLHNPKTNHRLTVLGAIQARISNLGKEYETTDPRLATHRNALAAEIKVWTSKLRYSEDTQTALIKQHLELSQLVDSNNTVLQHAREKKAIYGCQMTLFELQSEINVHHDQLNQVKPRIQAINSQLANRKIVDLSQLSSLNKTLSLIAQAHQSVDDRLKLFDKTINENPKLRQFKEQYEHLIKLYHLCEEIISQYKNDLLTIARQNQEIMAFASSICASQAVPIPSPTDAKETLVPTQNSTPGSAKNRIELPPPVTQTSSSIQTHFFSRHPYTTKILGGTGIGLGASGIIGGVLAGVGEGVEGDPCIFFGRVEALGLLGTIGVEASIITGIGLGIGLWASVKQYLDHSSPTTASEITSVS